VSNVNQVQDQVAKTLIYNLQQQVIHLIQRVDELEHKSEPNKVIGFHVRGGEQTLETAFINKRHHVPD
jgi:hypothetical protein